MTLTCNEVVLVDLRGQAASEGGQRWVLVDVMEGEGEGEEEEDGKTKKKYVWERRG